MGNLAHLRFSNLQFTILLNGNLAEQSPAIRCFPSQEAVKGHGRSDVLYRISLCLREIELCVPRDKPVRTICAHRCTILPYCVKHD